MRPRAFTRDLLTLVAVRPGMRRRISS
jgi:hypothetical protein